MPMQYAFLFFQGIMLLTLIGPCLLSRIGPYYIDTIVSKFWIRVAQIRKPSTVYWSGMRVR